MSTIDSILQNQTPILNGDENELAVAEAHSVQAQLSEAISTLSAGPLLETLLSVNDTLVEKLVTVGREDGASLLSSGERSTTAAGDRVESPVHEEELLSPRVDKGKGRAVTNAEMEVANFKVGDSDSDSDGQPHTETPALSLGGLPPASPSSMGAPSPTERLV